MNLSCGTTQDRVDSINPKQASPDVYKEDSMPAMETATTILHSLSSWFHSRLSSLLQQLLLVYWLRLVRLLKRDLLPAPLAQAEVIIILSGLMVLAM